MLLIVLQIIWDMIILEINFWIVIDVFFKKKQHLHTKKAVLNKILIFSKEIFSIKLSILSKFPFIKLKNLHPKYSCIKTTQILKLFNIYI